MLILCHNYYNVTPSNKNNKDAVHTGSKKRYIFGLFLLFMVNVLWVASAEITKYMYESLDLEHPFLITYARCSLLFVYLLVLCCSPPTKDPCRPSDYTQLLENTTENEEENYFNESTNSSLGDSTFVPVRAADATDSDDAAPRAVRFNKVAEVRVMSAAVAGEALLARLSWAASVRASELSQRRAAAAATRRHCRLAALFLVPWFAANYLHALSLQHVRPAAAAAALSAAAALAAALGALGGGDRLGWRHAASAALTLAGLVILFTLEARGSWAGAAWGAGAAACYAAHLALYRREARRPEGVNAPLVAGLVGGACLATMWALGAALARAGAERARLPPAAAAGWLLLDACAGPALCEALWLWGSSLTSARAATHSLLLSLALPLAAEAARGLAPAHAAAALSGAGWALAAGGGGGGGARFVQRLRELWARRVTRNIQDLDEQSEALMSAEEPT